MLLPLFENLGKLNMLRSFIASDDSLTSLCKRLCIELVIFLMHRIVTTTSDNTLWKLATATMEHDWKPPPTQRVKVNCTGAYDQGIWNSFLELVIRESLSTALYQGLKEYRSPHRVSLMLIDGLSYKRGCQIRWGPRLWDITLLFCLLIP